MSRGAAALLARHAGHRLVVLDAERTRCEDCSHTLLVKAGRAVLTEQDRPAHVERAVGACPLHVGEVAQSCRCCAADAKAKPDEAAAQPVDRQPTADVARWAAACRAAVAAAREARS